MKKLSLHIKELANKIKKENLTEQDIQVLLWKFSFDLIQVSHRSLGQGMESYLQKFKL